MLVLGWCLQQDEPVLGAHELLVGAAYQGM